MVHCVINRNKKWDSWRNMQRSKGGADLVVPHPQPDITTLSFASITPAVTADNCKTAYGRQCLVQWRVEFKVKAACTNLNTTLLPTQATTNNNETVASGKTFRRRLMVFTDPKRSIAIDNFLDNDSKAIHISRLRSRNKCLVCIFFNQYLRCSP